MGASFVLVAPVLVPLLLIPYRLIAPHFLPLLAPGAHASTETPNGFLDASAYTFLRYQHNYSLAAGGKLIPNSLSAVIERIVRLR